MGALMSASDKGPEKRRRGSSSLADEVYRSLHTAIVRGTYRPNQRLIETEIAEELGASRTPVREALQRLASEDLAVKSRQGWQVREFTIDEIRVIYEVRAALEGYAARLAASRASEADLTRLGQIVSEQQALLARGPRIPRDAVVELNDRFHETLTAAANNGRLADFARRNSTYYFNYLLAALYTDEQTAQSLEDHEWILEALRRRNPDKAEMLARQHITAAFELIQQKVP
jgi:DNA-binding GntR family transcriptional regulator